MAYAELNRFAVSGSPTRAMPSIFSGVVHFFQARATRNALHALSDRELADIGVERADIDAIAVGDLHR